MSGICGFVGMGDKGLLMEMLRLMNHRGESAETVIGDDWGLGTVGRDSEHVLRSEDSFVALMDQDIYAVGNKEVETLQELYEYLREPEIRNAIEQFRGSFAVVRIDTHSKRVVLARDMHGTRSLYYLMNDGTFFFASELKCFTAIDAFSPRLNSRALSYYLTCGFCPDEETLLKDVYKVMPSEIVTYEKENLNHVKYWTPVVSKAETMSLDYWTGMTWQWLTDTTRHMLASSGQKVGVSLSGGLDSSLVAATLKHTASEQRILAFTIAHEDHGESEAAFAGKVAETLDIETRLVELDPERIAKDLETLQWIYDEPMIKSTFIPTYYVFREAQNETKAVFTGDGGDELFLGYRPDYWEDPLVISVASKMPDPMRRLVHKMGKPLAGTLANSTGSKTLSLAAEFFSREQSSHHDWRFRTASRVFEPYFPEEELPELLAKNYTPYFVTDNVARSLSDSLASSQAEKTAHLKLRVLHDDLSRLDKATAASNVKHRSPLLDQCMTNWALSVPISVRYREKTTKYLLRQLISKYTPLPHSVIETKRKTGLSVPLLYWLTRTAIGDYVSNLIETVPHPFDPLYIKKSWPPKTYTKALRAWNLAGLLLWLKTFPGIRFRGTTSQS